MSGFRFKGKLAESNDERILFKGIQGVEVNWQNDSTSRIIVLLFLSSSLPRTRTGKAKISKDCNFDSSSEMIIIRGLGEIQKSYRQRLQKGT